LKGDGKGRCSGGGADHESDRYSHRAEFLGTCLECQECVTTDASLCVYVCVLRRYSGELLDLLLSIDKLLSTDEHFLLGVWLDSAQNLSTSQQERRLYEYNARNQITLWGPNGEVHTFTFINLVCLVYLLMMVLLFVMLNHGQSPRLIKKG